MPGLSDILRRFRTHGVPGPPGPLAVPADRVADAQQELAAVFAALDASQALVREMAEAAEREAGRRRSAAVEQGLVMLERARAQVPAARADATAAALVRGREEGRVVLAAAATEAERIDRAAVERTPALVELVVDRALARLGAPDAGGGSIRGPER